MICRFTSFRVCPSVIIIKNPATLDKRAAFMYNYQERLMKIMMIRTRILMGLNRLFKAPLHPFNMQNDGVKTYAEWQFEKGGETIKFYLKSHSADEMFKDKVIADIGCGAAGKSLYYASLGAKKVLGVEILEKYRDEANALAQKLGLADKFEFIAADAAHLPFETDNIDTIIMNDAMEHVDKPEEVLCEMLRVLAPGGKLFVNFPPYHHPFGAHLSDAIYIPWVHLFFSDKVLIEAYKELVRPLPDGEDRVKFRIAEDGKSFSYINRMTVKRFERILKKLNISPVYKKYEPLRSIFAPFAKLPLIREIFIKMVVCVIEKR